MSSSSSARAAWTLVDRRGVTTEVSTILVEMVVRAGDFLVSASGLSAIYALADFISLENMRTLVGMTIVKF